MSTALLEAVAKNDVAAVRKEALTADWDVRDEFGRNALGMAASRAGEHSVDVLRALLDAGADVNQAQGSDSDEEVGWTALHQACIKGTFPSAVDAVKLLLERGAQADGSSAAAVVSPLELALTTHHLGIAEALLKAGARPDALSKQGMAPLHQVVSLFRERTESGKYKAGAVAKMAVDAVTLLLAHGAKPGTPDSKGETALAKALLSKLPEDFVLALVNAGAPLDEWVDLGNPPKKVLVTPASMAVGLGQPVSVIVAMLKRGLDTTKPVAPDAQNLMHYAAMKRFDALQMILEHRPEQDVNVRDETGATPLFLASWVGISSAVKALLARGANPNIPDDGGNMPLHTAAKNDHDSVVKLLLEAGADKSARNANGQTAEDRARAEGNTTVAKLLSGA
ncbi:ankyrin repeat domain-containing protein [Myxococcus landrumensis]|uniref:Ankyrin repeat domain-containing protein n=1 Tax=Myxococcus landrumensis TaxID=2813577 RepID=A0ABX7N329_9BACT|nr:ankyrin repeat domain-containing protein [Myxococcus landrumus]QSQ11989.1 ankyrin repeat domain-containing protein [Myxococcus landrumus]